MKLTPEGIHDLSTVCTDFRIILDLIKSGYRFDDSEAPALMEQLENDLKILNHHLHQLKEEAV